MTNEAFATGERSRKKQKKKIVVVCKEPEGAARGRTEVVRAPTRGDQALRRHS